MDTDRLQAIYADLLDEIAPDWRNDENLASTPRRAAAFWLDFLTDDGFTYTSFNRVDADQLVAVSGVRVWSLCAHHLLPFWCDLDIGYIATDKLLGLSKLVRIARRHAGKLQLQERLVAHIADDLAEQVGGDVAVRASGEHLCLSMRGVETPAVMRSSVARGAFRDNPETRAEWLALTD